MQSRVRQDVIKISTYTCFQVFYWYLLSPCLVDNRLRNNCKNCREKNVLNYILWDFLDCILLTKHYI